MITGHRPSKLGGYGPSATQDAVRAWMRVQIRALLIEADETNAQLTLVGGMALGVDQWWAEEGLQLDVPVHAFVPFEGQESTWPTASQERYHEILGRCAEVTIVSPGAYAAWKMQARNVAMIEYANRHYAVWDGSSGGTANAVAVIRKLGLPLVLYPFETVTP